MGRRLQNIGMVAVMLLPVGLAGCGSKPTAAPASVAEPAPTTIADAPAVVERFCKLVTDWASAQRELRDADQQTEGGRYFRALQDDLRLFKDVPAAAPPSVAAEMNTITRIPPDPVKVSEARERDGAVARLDSYVATHCDARFSFAGFEFRP